MSPAFSREKMMIRLSRRRVLILVWHLLCLGVIAGLVFWAAPARAQSGATLTGPAVLDVGETGTWICGWASTEAWLRLTVPAEHYSGPAEVANVPGPFTTQPIQTSGSWDQVGVYTLQCEAGRGNNRFYQRRLTVTVGFAPGQVDYLAYSEANTTSATLIWDPPAPGSWPITGYNLRYRVNVEPKPDWTNISLGVVEARRIAGLTAGTSYEAQVQARNQRRSGPWSATRGFETNGILFRDSPPGNLIAVNIAQSTQRLSASLDWQRVLDATAYQVRITTPTGEQVVETVAPHLEVTYQLAENDDGGKLVFSVRGKRVANGETTFTPWSASVPLFYFGDSVVPVSEVLDEELAGSRATPQGVMDTRTSVSGAITEVSGQSGFEPDTQGILDFLSVLPAMLIVGMGAYAGMKFRALGLALGVSSVIAVMSMFVGTAMLGLDVIWPMLGLFGLIAFGAVAFVRKFRIATPVVLFAVLFAALHIAAIFAQNVAGFSLSGVADYGDSIWAGTPVDDLLALRRLDSYFDLRQLFTAMGDMFIGLYQLAVFDYAAFNGHEGAALWFVALIKLVLSLATSALTLTIIRQLFATGIFSSAAGLAMVVGGVGVATIVSSLFGGASGTPQASIAAAAQGADVTEGAAAVFVVSAVPAPEQPLIVNITVSQSGTYVPSGSIGNKSVIIPPSGSAQFTIPTQDDGRTAAAGSVTVSIRDAADGRYEGRAPTTATIAITPKR